MPEYTDPSPDQAHTLAAAAAENTEPVFMLNLLKFKETADGIDAGDGISGAEAYGRYASAIAPCLAAVGGEIVWSGACSEAVIGPEDKEWDVVAVVRYPSRANFLEMIADETYQAGHRHRSAGLADSRLVPCQGAGVAELA
jgi:uncharacterized protein (DUF1330 family)